MIWFDLSLPVSSAFTVATIAVILYSFSRLPQCAAALSISLVASKYAASVNAPEVHGAAMFFCALICVYGFRGRIPPGAGVKGINFAIAYLYAVRVIIIGWALVGAISIDSMWVASSEAALLLQLLIVAGGASYGRIKPVTHFFNRLRGSTRINHRVASRNVGDSVVTGSVEAGIRS